MGRLVAVSAALVAAATVAAAAAGTSTPEVDLESFREYFAKRFSDTPFQEYGNGVYAIDAASREQWEAIEDFPPYELNVDAGKALFETRFANGKSYADCFENGGIGIRQNYPHYDTERGEVVTLELAINECRVANGEEPLRYKKGPIADISSYMAYTSRGNRFETEVPDDPGAREWYERGKRQFYAKRGQLNLACADCHVYNAGNRVRADLLSPALGQVTHFPVYRSKWGGIGTLHRRYAGCHEQVRAKPFKAQSEEYRALEYFHTFMSKGLEANGPGARK